MQRGCRRGRADGQVAVEAVAAHDVVAGIASNGGFILCKAGVASAGPVFCCRRCFVVPVDAAAVGLSFAARALIVAGSSALLWPFELRGIQ